MHANLMQVSSRLIPFNDYLSGRVLEPRALRVNYDMFVNE